LVERATQVPAVHARAEGRDRPSRAAGDRSVRDVCREYQIAETLYYQWRERLLDGGKTALAHPRDKTPEQTQIEQLSARLGSSSGWRQIPGVNARRA
jgi:transposase-like protein